MSERIALKPQLERLREALAEARFSRDPEAIHKVRTAVQRIRAYLWHTKENKVRRRLGAWRQTLGRARDFDVHIAAAQRDGDSPVWTNWLRERRDAEQLSVEAALTSDEVEEILHRLERTTPIKRADLLEGLRKLAERTLLHAILIQDGDQSGEAFHDLRRDVKKVRYTLEWLGEPLHGLKDVQDVLGELNDRVVTLELISEHPDPVALVEKVARLEEEIAERKARFLAFWPTWRSWFEALAVA